MNKRVSFFLLFMLVMMATFRPIAAQQPTRVTLAGTFQKALGCDADWMPECEATALAFDETDQLWVATFPLAAGNYEYKVALNGSWDENYGLGSEAGAANIPLQLSADGDVTFFYDPITHYIADNINRALANLPGNWNSEQGCPDTPLDDPANAGDWAPDCAQTLLQDPDGDGVYTFITNRLPAGSYETKVALNGSWGENYGDGGAANGGNIGFTVAKDGAEIVFSWDFATKLLTVFSEDAPKGNLTELTAYWVAPDTLLTTHSADNQFFLAYSPTGELVIDATGVIGGEQFSLTPATTLDPVIAQKFPHLAKLTPLTLPPEQVGRVRELVRGQLALSVLSADGTPITTTGLQLPGVLDSQFSYEGALGVSWADGLPTLRVWAPTAQTVQLLLFADSTTESAETVAMTRDEQTGVWSVTGSADWRNRFYQYEVTVYTHYEQKIVTNRVTDPYSFSLSTNSQRSQLIDWQDPALQPENWQNVSKPPLNAFEEIVLYELHVRDFSIYDETVPEAQRGTFAAFSQNESNGMRHLRRLAQAGLTHIHLLPVFDIATIQEDRALQKNPLDRYLGGFSADSDQQQNAVNGLRDQDGFNWGYDPYHYTVPEGSYSTNPKGPQRIVEFRQMVQSLNQNGLRVVMDVVYNHTNASGQSDRSVLDRLVPGYYHRLNSKGKVESSTCCANTATEHTMMRKLMIDSVVTWATQYKVDGFRFDLMGHHMKSDLEAVRTVLDSLDLANDGVNGKAIYLYGEGWDFGEVAGNARGTNATQRNMNGTGIGTFNDRLRDAVRGGNPFGGLQEQGFATGLATDPNEATNDPISLQRARLKLFGDQIKVGLAGNLADYRLIGYDGKEVRGADVDYNGAPTGYTQDPQEVINYAEAHDNETFFDIIQYKAPVTTPMDQRVRMQGLGHDLIMFGQGVPFFHAGSELLRSKSADRDSYNSGDWFNRLDFTYQTNNWGVGLPIADKNEDKWPILRPLLADPALKPSSADILASLAHFEESLQIRRSSPLFRLRTASEVQNRLRFYNNGPDQIGGLIVMELDDSGETRIDPNFNRIVVVFNGTPETQSYTIEALAAVEIGLHPVQQNSADSLVRTATFANGTFSVPGRTTAVFVEAGDANTTLPNELAGVHVGSDEMNPLESHPGDHTSAENSGKSGYWIPLLITLLVPLCLVGLAVLIVLLFLGLLGLTNLASSDEEA